MHFGQRPLASDLGQSEAVVIAVDHAAKPLEEAADRRMRLVVEMLLEIERAESLAAARRGRVIAQFRVVHREIDGIEAKAVDPAIKPEASYCKHRILSCGIMQVEVGLLGQE